MIDRFDLVIIGAREAAHAAAHLARTLGGIDTSPGPRGGSGCRVGPIDGVLATLNAVNGRGLRVFSIRGTLVLAALALGHELTYLLAHGVGDGYARAMQEGGHDRYWTSFVLIVLLVTAALSVVAAAQWQRLRRLAADVQAGMVRLDDGGLNRFLELLQPLWIRVSAGTIAAYILQENIETASTGAALPGLGVFGGEHAIAVPTVLAVSLAVAAVGALVGWRREVLLARIKAAGRRRLRAPIATLRPALVSDRPAGRIAERLNGVRAPPLPKAA